MMIRAIRFNLYLFAGVSLFLGCESSPEAKHQQEVSTLRLHLEAPREQDDRSLEIKISRGHPIPIRVLNDSFLDEAYVSKAEVVDGTVLAGINCRSSLIVMAPGCSNNTPPATRASTWPFSANSGNPRAKCTKAAGWLAENHSPDH